jgi:hypothetical protein
MWWHWQENNFIMLYPKQKHSNLSSVCGSSWSVLIHNYTARLRNH